MVFALKPSARMCQSGVTRSVQERKCSWSSGRLDTIKKKLDWMVGVTR